MITSFLFILFLFLIQKWKKEKERKDYLVKFKLTFYSHSLSKVCGYKVRLCAQELLMDGEGDKFKCRLLEWVKISVGRIRSFEQV